MSAHPAPLSHPKYRPDIDGLRAIAVIAVVVFHAFPTALQGGFVGVDVFFVISGYLISTIIFENLDTGTFSFAEFYARRIKRIFPALALVLITCFVLGWFILLPFEYKQLGKHMAAGSGFVSNLVFWNEAGYFDTASDTKPLLHLWSLGIEEQFYIVWPLLLWFAWKCRFNLLALTALFLAGSFALNLLGIQQDPVATFYSPQTRFWELLAGALLAWATLYKKDAFTHIKNRFDADIPAHVVSLSGIVLLACGYLWIDKSIRFPGIWALVPVCGAVLLIAAGPHAFFNRHILSSKLAVWFGLISFPLYLWHWPLLSFARIIESQTPGVEIRMVAVVLAVVLAWLTVKLIERPVRSGHRSKAKVITLVLLMTLIGSIGYNTYTRDGLVFRGFVRDIQASIINSGFDGEAGVALQETCGVQDEAIRSKVPSCLSDTRERLKFALIGDSKAVALFPGLVRTSTDQGRWMFIGGVGPTGTAVPVISEAPIYQQNQTLAPIAIEAVAKNKQIEKVVLVTASRALFHLNNDSSIEDLPASKHYGDALNGLKATIEILKGAGKKTILLVDNPTLPHPEDCFNRASNISFIKQLGSTQNSECVLSLEKHQRLSKKYRDLLDALQASHPNDVQIFDTTALLCDQDKQVCTQTRNGRALYSYTDHISDYAAGLIGRGLNEFLVKK